MTQSTPKKPQARQPKKVAPKQRECIVVIGMHRSGTSALSGLLSILGCDQANTQMPPSSENEKGYFESQKIYSFHTNLLNSAGSRWDDWLQFNSGWFESQRADEFHDDAKALLEEEYGQSRMFVLKDPRICRFVPFWGSVLSDMEISPRYVLTCRSPLEVAASLEARDGLNPNISLLIWLRHVLDAEIGTRQETRSFTNFGQLIDNWASVADKLQDDLNINLPRMTLGIAPEVEAFLLGDLRHHTQTTEKKFLHNPLISSWIRDTYEILNRWSVDGEDPKDYAQLDEIRNAFNITGPLFARVVQAGRDDQALVQETEQRLETLNNENISAQEEATALRKKLQLSSQKSEAHEAANANIEAQRKELEDSLSQTQSALEQRSLEAEETHVTLGKLHAENAELARAHEAANANIEAQRKELEDSLSQTQSALEQRSLEAEETHVALGTKLDELAELTQLLSDREAALAQDRTAMEHVLEREKRQRKEAETQLVEAGKKEKLERTQANVLHSREAIDLNRQIKRQSEEMAKISNLLVTNEQTIQLATFQAEAALEAARERAKQAEFTTIEIQNSTSWRATKPLRKLMAIFRRDI